MQPLLNIAIRAARRAGEVIVRSLNRLESLTITSKGRNDFVTEVDRNAEQEIIGIIRRHYPDHALLAEESGRSGEHDTVWIIDPLDGTTNFLHGFPMFAVSIACQTEGPARACGGLRSHAPGALHRDAAAAARIWRIIACGSASSARSRALSSAPASRSASNTGYLDAYLEMLKAAMQSTAGVRRPGAAALDLAYVAAGRVDGFWEIGLSPWDTAAGTLLIQEAGGRIGTLTGGEYQLGADVLAGTPKVYAALIELFAPHVPEALRTS